MSADPGDIEVVKEEEEKGDIKLYPYLSSLNPAQLKGTSKITSTMPFLTISGRTLARHATSDPSWTGIGEDSSPHVSSGPPCEEAWIPTYGNHSCYVHK